MTSVFPSPSPEHNHKAAGLATAAQGKRSGPALPKFPAPELFSSTKLTLMVNTLFKPVFENIKNTTRKGDEMDKSDRRLSI